MPVYNFTSTGFISTLYTSIANNFLRTMERNGEKVFGVYGDFTKTPNSSPRNEIRLFCNHRPFGEIEKVIKSSFRTLRTRVIETIDLGGDRFLFRTKVFPTRRKLVLNIIVKFTDSHPPFRYITQGNVLVFPSPPIQPTKTFPYYPRILDTKPLVWDRLMWNYPVVNV